MYVQRYNYKHKTILTVVQSIALCAIRYKTNDVHGLNRQDLEVHTIIIVYKTILICICHLFVIFDTVTVK